MTDLDDLTDVIADSTLHYDAPLVLANRIRAAGYRRVVVDDAMVAAMQGARSEHDAIRHSSPCFEHERFCCPTGDAHDMRRSEAMNHRDRAALTAALGDVRTEEELEAEFRPIRRTP